MPQDQQPAMAEHSQPDSDLHEQMQIRLNKLRALSAGGQDPFAEVAWPVTHHSQEIISQFDSLEGQQAWLAGRIMSKRGMGKVSFCDLADEQGRIQLFTKIDALGDAAYAEW